VAAAGRLMPRAESVTLSEPAARTAPQRLEPVA
jgi:hypothetical protein